MNHAGAKIKRSERACKPCRDLKVRCLPCAERDDICQKCQRSGAVCIFEEPKPRKRRKVDNSSHDLSTLQAKLSDLNAQIETCRSKQRSHVGVHGSDSPGPSVSYHDEYTTAGGTTSHSETSFSQAVAAEATCSEHLGSNIQNSQESQHVSTVQYLIGNGVLSREQVSSCLSIYQKMCAYSPFVPVGDKVSFEELATSQPFTLHAILMVSSREDKTLQNSLESSFRDRILQTIMIDGEKSVDLLCALIVYLTWYHFFYIPMKQQFYQTLQVAIGLCIDLKLDRPPENTILEDPGLQASEHGGLQFDTAGDELHSRSARRAYVACFCISTITSWIWCKPSNFPHTDYLIKCARSLFEDPEFATDALILPLLETQVLGNDQHLACLVSESKLGNLASVARVKTNFGRFSARLNEVKAKARQQSVSLDLASLYAASYGHEMNLLNPCNLPPTDDSKRSLVLTPSRRAYLIFCLESASKVLETFLTLSLDEYSWLSILQWWPLVCNTAYLYRLCLGIPQLPEWDVRIPRESAKLELYLDLLCYRLQHATGSTVDAPVGRDLYSLLCPIFTNVKRSYERLKRLPRTTSAKDKHSAHASIFSDGLRDHSRKSSTHQSRCPAFRYVSRADDIDLSPALNDLNGNAGEATEMSDIDIFLNLALFEGEGDWLGEMPQFSADLFDTGNHEHVRS